ncbi:MAG: T9SS type A sorting domain-containing protein [Cytophagales bacterium]|nr:T9SS type A sorting domain-containing protein [Cytophagales bacterium]MDW8383612.1 T9SS type A sorting domain-containing protein [Flammeovirgaceae bacterium]
MKKRLFNIALLFIFPLIGLIRIACAQTATSNASGNWNSAIWTTAGGCTYTPGQGLSSNCNVTIANGHTVTMDISDTIASLTINSGNANSTLNMGSMILFCSGNVTINANTAGIFKTLNVNDGTLIVGGNLAINGGSGGDTQDARVLLNNGIINVQGNLIFGQASELRNYIHYTGTTGIVRVSGNLNSNNNNGGFGDGSGGSFVATPVHYVVAPISLAASNVRTDKSNLSYLSLTVRCWQPVVNATATVTAVNNAGGITGISLTTSGVGYPINATVPVVLSGGSGKHAAFNITTTSLGLVSSIGTAVFAGIGYQVGDVVTLTFNSTDLYISQLMSTAATPTPPHVTFNANYTIPSGVTLTVDDNAILQLGTLIVSGVGNFVMKSNSIVRISNATGVNGAITNTGTKDLNNSGANDTGFDFIGTAGGTGSDMPASVNHIIVAGAARTLSQATTVKKNLAIVNNNFNLNNPITFGNDCNIIRKGTSNHILINGVSFPGNNEAQANVFGVRHFPCEYVEPGFPSGGCTPGLWNVPTGTLNVFYSRTGADINIGPEIPRRVVPGLTLNVYVNMTGNAAIFASNDKSSSDGVQNKLVINGTLALIDGELRFGSETAGVFGKSSPSIQLPELQVLGPIRVVSGRITAPNPPFGNLIIGGTGAIVGSPFTSTATFNQFTLNRSGVTITIGTGSEIRVNEKLNLLAGTLDVGSGTLVIRDYDFTKAARARITVSSGQVTGLATVPFLNGSGYTNQTNVPIPGAGTGGLMNIYTQNGAVTHLELVNFGSGYGVSSTFNIPGGDGQAFGFYRQGPANFATLVVGRGLDNNTTYSPGGFTVGQRVAVLASAGATVGNGAARMQITSVDAFGKITGATVVNGGAGYPNGDSIPAILVPFGATTALNISGGTLNVGASSTLAFDLENNTTISGISTLFGFENRGSGTLNITQPLTILNRVVVTGSGNVNCNGNLTLANNAVVLDTTTGPNGGGRVVGTCKMIRQAANHNRYNYVSSPITNAPVSLLTANSGKAAFMYDETHPQYAGPSWINVPTSFTMTPGRGYAAYKAGTITFTGTFNSGNVSIPVTRTANNAVDSIGWNLIGNPYPSSISVPSFINSNSSLGITHVYLYDDASDVRTSDRYVSINAFGAVTNVTSPTYVSPQPFIASGQGFFVKVNTNGNVVFRDSIRRTVHNNQFYREEAGKEKVWIAATDANGENINTILVGCSPEATEGEDLTMDAPKKRVAQAGVQLYSLLNNRRYVIQAKDELLMGSTKTFPIGIEVKNAGTYVLSTVKKEGFEDAKILLEDTQSDEVVDLEQGPYSVTLPSGETNNRFLLHLSREEAVLSTRVNKKSDVSSVKIFSDGTSAYVDLSSQAEATIAVMNTVGQVVVAPFIAQGGSILKLNAPLNSGIYVVKVTTSSGVVSDKVLIK